ncbi:MAG: DUF6148 family protein [Armatimonadota bacterium]
MSELDTARERLQMWLDAEAAVATGQSYRIGNRQLERANLADIRESIKYWQSQVNRLESGRDRGARVFRIIPRDR